MVNRILEISFTLIVIYLVLAKPQAFSSSISAIGGVYAESVRTLQGR